MQKVLETLIDLQEIDLQLQRLEAEKGDLPQKVQNLAVQVEQTRALLDQQKVKKDTLTSERKTINNDVEIVKQKLKKYKVQLYQVKTNKEYDAITLEIETSERTIDEQEYKSLELEDSVKILEEEISATEKKLVELNGLLVDHKKDLETKLATTWAEEETLQSRRLLIVEALTKPTLSAYERIRHGRGGYAVAKLVNGACSACSSRVPPQRALEIRMMNKINLCEVCGRIVVWEPEYTAANETE